MVVVDVGPWGRVLDLYPVAGQISEQIEAARLVEGEYESKLLRDVLRISNGVHDVVLEVIQRDGGNQHNVWSNLLALQTLFPDANLDVTAHHSAGQVGSHRQNLHLMGDNRVRLVTPKVRAQYFPESVDGRVMISSAESDSVDSLQWQWVRRLAQQGTEFYWNPGRRQLNGGLTQDTLDALEGRVRVIQMNEKEVVSLRRNYGRVPEADWTVLTLGENGSQISINEDSFSSLVQDNMDFAQKVFPEAFSQHPVGCGDAYLAALIAAIETHEGVDPKWAAQFASYVSGIQYQHQGSNLLSVIDRLVACREEIPYDLKRGISRRAVV